MDLLSDLIILLCSIPETRATIAEGPKGRGDTQWTDVVKAGTRLECNPGRRVKMRWRGIEERAREPLVCGAIAIARLLHSLTMGDPMHVTWREMLFKRLVSQNTLRF